MINTPAAIRQAAAATSTWLTFAIVLLFWFVRQRLGLNVLASGKSASKGAPQGWKFVRLRDMILL